VRIREGRRGRNELIVGQKTRRLKECKGSRLVPVPVSPEFLLAIFLPPLYPIPRIPFLYSLIVCSITLYYVLTLFLFLFVIFFFFVKYQLGTNYPSTSRSDEENGGGLNSQTACNLLYRDRIEIVLSEINHSVIPRVSITHN